MAKKGTSKYFSEIHEQFIAARFGGVRSPSSGGHVTDAGDVRVKASDGSVGVLVECKHTGSFEKPAKSITIDLGVLEKICDEAWSEGKTPVLALRMYNPESILSDANGMIDLITKLERDSG